MPQHVGFLIKHPPVVHRDYLSSLDIQIGLPCKRRSSPRISPARAFQSPKPFTKGDLCLIGHRLIGKQQDKMLIKRRANFHEGRIVQRLGDVDPGNAGAEHGRNRRDG